MLESRIIRCYANKHFPDFISHSVSREQLKFIFTDLLPDLSGKLVLDVGSRLGPVLYGVNTIIHPIASGHVTFLVTRNRTAIYTTVSCMHFNHDTKCSQSSGWLKPIEYLYPPSTGICVFTCLRAGWRGDEQLFL